MGLIGCICSAVLATALETAFELPQFVRQPLFEIVKLENPIENLDQYPSSHVVSLNHRGTPLQCAIPTATIEPNYPLEPLTNPDTISMARDLLKPLENVVVVETDDIWGWSVSFGKSVVQFIPHVTSSMDSFAFSADRFYASTGRSHMDEEGGCLALAKPIVINDKHAMMTTFKRGSWCEVSRDYRKTNMFFVCDPNADDRPVLKSIWEPHSCTYEMTWGVKDLCRLPEFNESLINRNQIMCGPAPGLDEEAYEIYRLVLQQEQAGSAPVFSDIPDFRDKHNMAFIGPYPV